MCVLCLYVCLFFWGGGGCIQTTFKRLNRSNPKIMRQKGKVFGLLKLNNFVRKKCRLLMLKNAPIFSRKIDEFCELFKIATFIRVQS